MLRHHAVVTGAARVNGIGRAIVRALVNSGDWAVTAIDASKWEEESDDALDMKWVHAAQASVVDESEVEQAVRDGVDTFGPLMCVVNNAAVSNPYMHADSRIRTSGAAHDYIAEFRRVVDINLTGALVVTACASQYFSTESGLVSVIHMSSTRARQSEPHSEAYAASKAGLIGLTHAQAVSMAHRARVNVILPGWIDTSDSAAHAPKERDHAFHLTGRAGVPRDIAELVLFLADNSRSGFITGQEFVVDGGVTRKMMYPED